MKKVFLAVALAGFAQAASADVANSAHNLSHAGASSLSACQYCHTPHKAQTVQNAPLWNRALVSTGLTTYTTLAGTTMSLGANSLTCLSCHDGQTAMGDTLGTDDATPGFMTLASSYAFIGTNLAGNHPVGVNYVVAPGKFKAVANDDTTVKLYTSGANLTVECGSCHDPHGRTGFLGGGSDGTAAAAGGTESFLRVSIATICTDCHAK